MQTSSILPTNINRFDLPERFSFFFYNKIDTLRAKIDSIVVPTDSQPLFSHMPTNCNFNCFKPLVCDELYCIINNYPIKTSPIDPLPKALFKASIDILLPSLLHLINLSLSSGIFPDSMKLANIRPLIKKIISRP